MENLLCYVGIWSAFNIESGEGTPAGRLPKRHPVSTEREVKHGFKKKKNLVQRNQSFFISESQRQAFVVVIRFGLAPSGKK